MQITGEALVVRFHIDAIPFEIFACAEPSVQQSAYRHFLIEERILKAGGLRLKNKIQCLRETGEKTEPAFAKALGLNGDPFVKLLELGKLSCEELRAWVQSQLPAISSAT